MIRIVKGVYGYREGKTILPKSSKDGPISLPPEEEARLVALGVAETVTPGAPAPEQQTGPRAYNDTMKLEELKDIAVKDYGLPEAEVEKLRSKSGVVEAIDQHRAGGQTTEPETQATTDEQPPQLTPEAPQQ